MKASHPITSVVWLVLEKVIVLSLSLLVTLAIARHLLPSSFGRLNFLLALVSLAAPLMALGLNSLITREVLQRPRASSMIVGSALAMRFVVGLVVAILCSFTCYFLLPFGEWYLLTLLLVSSAFQAGQVVDYWLQAHVANRYAAIVRLLVLLVMSVLRLTAVYLDAELQVFVYLLSIEFVLMGICYLGAYHRLAGGLGQLRTSIQECRDQLMQSRWLLLSGLAAILYLKIDQVMLGVMQGDSAVGIYSAASRISEIWYFVPAALVTSYFPQLIQKRAAAAESYAIDIQKINDFLLALALTMALFVSANANWLMATLFGEAYIDAAPVLVIHVWGAVFIFMRTLLSKWLITENLLHLSLLSQASGAMANISLNLYLIPLYGPVGAAYATVFGYFVAGYLVLFLHRDLKPMALVVSRSLVLPIRILRWGKALYAPRA